MGRTLANTTGRRQGIPRGDNRSETQLPTEIWEHILKFLLPNEAYMLSHLHPVFLYHRMRARYESVTLRQAGPETTRMMDRLLSVFIYEIDEDSSLTRQYRDPFVAKFVRTLRVNTRIICDSSSAPVIPWHKRARAAVKSAGPLFSRNHGAPSMASSLAHTSQSVSSLLQNLKFLEHYIVEWEARPSDIQACSVDTQDYFAWPKNKPFLHKLTIIIATEHLRPLLRTLNSLQALRNIRVEFDGRSTGRFFTFGPLQTSSLGPFVARYKETLEKVTYRHIACSHVDLGALLRLSGTILVHREPGQTAHHHNVQVAFLSSSIWLSKGPWMNIIGMTSLLSSHSWSITAKASKCSR